MTAFDEISGFATALQIGPTVTTWPFPTATPPDVYARQYLRPYRQRVSSWRPGFVTPGSYTNKKRYSGDYTVSAWTKTNVTVDPAVIANPWSGEITGSQLYETSATGSHYIYDNITAVDAAQYTYWAVVKKEPVTGVDWVRLAVTDYSTTVHDVWINLDTGAAGTTHAATPLTSVDLGNDWWLVGFVFTAAGTGVGVLGFYLADADGSSSYAGTVSFSVYVAHIQLESGAVPTQYIPTTSAVKTVTTTPDPADPFAYLVEDSDPQPSPTGLTLTFNRLFCRLPAPQIFPATKLFDRPNLHDIQSGSAYGVSFDNGYSSWIFKSRITIAVIGSVDTDTKTVTGTITRAGTVSGTGTLSGTGTVSGTGTIGTSGTALGSVSTVSSIPSGTISTSEGSFFLSNDASTIRSVLSGGAISGVQVVKSDDGGISVSWTAGTLDYVDAGSADVVVSATDKSFTITPSTATTGSASRSLTDSRATTDTRATLDTRATTDTADLTDTHATTETYYPRASVRYFTTSTAHGATAGDHVVFWQGPRVVATSIVIAITSTTIFACLLKDVSGDDFAAATVGFSTDADYRVLNGAIRCSARLTQSFYLPGVTAGITDASDIDPPDVYTTAEAWLGQAVAYLDSPSNATYAAIEVSDLAVWHGPILMQEVTSLQMADAIDVMTP